MVTTSPTLAGECASGFWPTTLLVAAGLSTITTFGVRPTLLNCVTAWTCDSLTTYGPPPCTEPGPAQYDTFTDDCSATALPATGSLATTLPSVQEVLCTWVAVPSFRFCCDRRLSTSVRLRPIRFGTCVSCVRFVR